MAKVLIVDDEPMCREFLSLAISKQGHDVQCAGSGHEAIEIGESFCPDVLIADWMLMDDLCGLEVSESLRESNPNMATIIITGFPSQELRIRAKESNVFAFLEKPFGLDVIREAVCRATMS